MTWTGTTWRIYLNGALDASGTQTVLPYTTGVPSYIGYAPGYSYPYAWGTIAEVALYDGALTTTEVAAHYAARTAWPGFDAGTIAFRASANPQLSARAGTLNAAGQTATVTQSGIASSLTVDRGRVGPGTTVTVEAWSTPGNRGDWLGLYVVGASDTSPIAWMYLATGGQVYPSQGTTHAQLSIPMPTAAGAYEFRLLQDGTNLRLATSSSVVVSVPVVALTSPSSGATAGVGNAILMAASASSSGGYINTVDYSVNGAFIGSAHSAPWQWTWTPGAVGTYTIRALATDDLGSQVSDSRALSVVTEAGPVVNVTNPPPSATFLAGATVTLSAEASEPGGTIGNVAYYVDGEFVGNTTGLFQMNWSTAVSGLHTITALAVDTNGVGAWTNDVLPVSIVGQASGQSWWPRPSDRYGIVTPFADDPREVEAVKELGVGLARFTLYWGETEPNDQDFRFEKLYSQIDRAIGQAGLDLYVDVGQQTPAWAGPCSTCAPFRWEDWESFFETVLRSATSYIVDHYPIGKIVFGVWNEPNLEKFLTPHDPQVYVELFRHASIARDRVSTSIRLGGPETSHHAIASDSYFANTLIGIRPYMHASDVVTVHWYSDGPDLATYMTDVSHLVGDHEVWLTESNARRDASDSEQSTVVSTILNSLDARQAPNLWTRAFIYRLRLGDTDQRETLLRIDWSRRPAFSTYAQYTAFWSPRKVNLVAANGQYVSAENGGGGSVIANQSQAGVSEDLYLIGLGSRWLRSGSNLIIRTSGGWFLSAAHGGGGTLLANSDGSGLVGGVPVTTFVLERLAGAGEVRSGDVIALRTPNGHYVCAPAGGGVIDATSTSPSDCAAFTIVLPSN